MGLFSNLFGRRDREIAELMNPVLGMKLQEFVIADDDPNYLKHYFKFRNKEGEGEEFICFYRRSGSQLSYLLTKSRRAVWGPEFQTLSESGPWSITITHLIELGQQLSTKTRPTRGHLASTILPEKPQATNSAKATTSPPPQRPNTPIAPPVSVGGSRTSVDATPWEVKSAQGFEGSQESGEISQTYHYSNPGDPSPSAIFRIVCTVACTLDGTGQVIVHRRLRFYLQPFSLSQEAPLTMRLYARDRSLGGTFSVVAEPVAGEQDTAVIARYAGKDDVTNCLKALMSGKHMTFQLANRSETLVDLPLPSDQAFKDVYDETCALLSKNAASGRRQSRELARTFAIVIIPPNADQAHGVWLMNLDEKGEIDFSLEEFVLAQTATRDAALNYAMGLANLMKLRVLEIAKT
jgi:hypothetical protein